MSTDKPGRRLCQALNCEWTKQLLLCECVMHPVSAAIIVSCSERFTPCDLPDAVGAPVGETLLERSALLWFTGPRYPCPRGSGCDWASLSPAGLAHPFQSSKTRTTSRRTSHPNAHLLTPTAATLSIADPGLCDSRPRDGPRLTTRTLEVPQAHMRALASHPAIDRTTPYLGHSDGYESRVLAAMESNDP